MKLEIKKIALLLVTGIIVISGAIGAAEDAMPMEKIQLSEKGLQQIPKFQKFKFINKIQGYKTEAIIVNDSLLQPAPGVIDYVIKPKNPDNIQTTMPGAAWPMYSIRLVLKDTIGKIDSGEKVVTWKSSNDKKAEIHDIFGEKLPGVDATLELDKDTLNVTVERKTQAKKESDKKESIGKSKSATF